jgi:hypothetical protein
MIDPPEIEDLTLTPDTERTSAVSVELSASDQTMLQAEADKRGVTLEEYVRWRLLTSAALHECRRS